MIYVAINMVNAEQNGRHFADTIFTRIFSKEKVSVLNQISLQFVPKGPIDKLSLIQVPRHCPNQL